MKKKLIAVGLVLLVVDRLTKMMWDNSQNPNLFYWQINQRILIVFSLVVITGLLFWLMKVWSKTKKYLVLGLWLIILGGFSNVYDRVVYGYVIDWIDFYISVFNIADVMIVIGCGLVLLTGIDKI